VTTPAEAVRALCAIKPGFEKFLMNAKDNGLGFSVFVGKTNLSAAELRNTGAAGDIRIAPMVLGSKNGLGQIILGVVLIVVGVYIQYESGGPNSASNYLYGMGINMIIGGVMQLLAPHPKDRSSKDKGDQVPSYAFNGSVNTMAQGNPVPLLYGKMKAGSAVISAGIYAEDNMTIPDNPTGGTTNVWGRVLLAVMGGGGGANFGDMTHD